VTPEPHVAQFPALLDFPAPTLKSYPTYTVVAEKLEALVLLGKANSRMKDFYDLWFLSRRFPFDGNTLSAAITATFQRRKTPLPKETPSGLRREFAELKAVQWNAFLRKSHLEGTELEDVLSAIGAFTMPPLEAAATGQPFVSKWTPETGWAVAGQ